MNTRARFDYSRDDARRRVRVTAHEPLRKEDLLAIVDHQIADDAWAYGMLYDLRAVRGATPRAEVTLVAEHVSACITTLGPRGPVALVTRTIDMVGTGQIYARLGAKVGFRVEVFWDLAEAEHWLDGPQSPP